MKKPLKLECIDPTQSLTKGGVYHCDRTIQKDGVIHIHFVSWENADYVIVNDDNHKPITVSSYRFKRIDEQGKGKTSTEG